MLDKRKLIGLDFETYGAVDLFKHGLERYASDPSFKPLIASTARVSNRLPVFWKDRFDFVKNGHDDVEQMRDLIGDRIICAHNAGFEQRTLSALGYDLPSDRFIDSAVLARAMGAGGKLEAAAPQLLGIDKLESGKNLIQLFSIPGKLQELDPRFDDAIVAANPDEWKQFGIYCDLDAELSLRLVLLGLSILPERELAFAAITQDMNLEGWHVDVELVKEMQRRYLENQEQALQDFRDQHDPKGELNLNSLKQLKEWCAERGVRATSFNEKNVAKLISRIDKKLDTLVDNRFIAGDRYNDYLQVRRLLETKQILGGSSLKKLQVILDTVGADGRLRDQYLHIGAGQSWRTTGRSVQMQNLKRLAEPGDTDELYDDESEWDNEKLAANIRQVFTSRHPQGRLIVGDFSSVESRGLAWLAGAQWKLDAFVNGKDMYKVLATKIYPGTSYDQVTKVQRQTGKVGELSCGYQAGGGAVQMFAENMGVEMSEGEANQLVNDWRLANPEVVGLWIKLDDVLNAVLDGMPGGQVTVGQANSYILRLEREDAPESLQLQHPGAFTIKMMLVDMNGQLLLVRFFHGAYRRGRNICYYKPSQLKTGDLWSSHYVDPKTKQVRFFSIYGGKLAGILTQSLCREIFFRCLQKVSKSVSLFDHLHLVGQFHDEIVLDWTPNQIGASNDISLGSAIQMLKGHMSDNGGMLGFPLVGDVHAAYRYIK